MRLCASRQIAFPPNPYENVEVHLDLELCYRNCRLHAKDTCLQNTQVRIRMTSWSTCHDPPPPFFPNFGILPPLLYIVVLILCDIVCFSVVTACVTLTGRTCTLHSVLRSTTVGWVRSGAPLDLSLSRIILRVCLSHYIFWRFSLVFTTWITNRIQCRLDCQVGQWW